MKKVLLLSLLLSQTIAANWKEPKIFCYKQGNKKVGFDEIYLVKPGGTSSKWVELIGTYEDRPYSVIGYLPKKTIETYDYSTIIFVNDEINCDANKDCYYSLEMKLSVKDDDGFVENGAVKLTKVSFYKEPQSPWPSVVEYLCRHKNIDYLKLQQEQ